MCRLAAARGVVWYLAMSSPQDPKDAQAADKVVITLEELIEEGLRIQHRFAPEPIYAKTERGSGRGFLRPSGVDEIAAAKELERAKARQRTQDGAD